jgi:post-segregation antitoxin (ccd killing protein)
MKQNITLSIEKDLIQKARILAVQRQTSVSGLLSQELERLVLDTEAYERAKKKAVADLNQGFHFGGKVTATREELHER